MEEGKVVEILLYISFISRLADCIMNRTLISAIILPFQFAHERNLFLLLLP